MRYYDNVMELLVDQEIERQLDELPAKLIRYINRFEVATYALNRLPALYASSAEGWRQQKLKGEKTLRNQISTAVRQALVAIQRDPIRRSTPLKRAEKTQDQAVQATLQELQDLLQDQALSWQDLTRAVEQALAKTAQLMRRGDKGMRGRGETPCIGTQRDVAQTGHSSKEVLGIRRQALSSQTSFSSPSLKTGAVGSRPPARSKGIASSCKAAALTLKDDMDVDTTSGRRPVSSPGRLSPVTVTQQPKAHLPEQNDCWSNSLYRI